ncbi:MAG: type II secretion system protein [Caldimonas sp.]
MKRKTRGYTLIEQLVVIAAAGTASATALPALIDLQAQAESTALVRLAGTASAAMAVNFGGCLVTGHVVAPGKCIAIDNCNQIGAALVAGLPDGYRVADVRIGDGGPPVNGIEAACTLTQTRTGANAGFYGIAAGK